MPVRLRDNRATFLVWRYSSVGPRRPDGSVTGAPTGWAVRWCIFVSYSSDMYSRLQDSQRDLAGTRRRVRLSYEVGFTRNQDILTAPEAGTLEIA
jgi:hypothetical protein